MSNANDLKPSFDVEFPHSERKLPDSVERAIEQGVLTPRMVGYVSRPDGSVNEIKVPQSSDEVDEVQLAAEKMAAMTGRHPDDHDWRAL